MEKLYNNIILPDDFMSKPSDAQNVPYLKNPPELINVSVGRQLFVDDFLIESTDLAFNYHVAEKFVENPVLKPEMPWESETRSPSTVPKSGGIFYDEDEKLFKCWYETGWLHQMCYATSKDGIRWERPELDLVPGTNKILPWEGVDMRDDPLHFFRPDSTTFWIDYDEPDKSKRYKFFLRCPGGNLPGPCTKALGQYWGYYGIVGTSPDGIHWENLTLTTPVDDRSTVFYNPFRKKWVYSIRDSWHKDENYRYVEGLSQSLEMKAARSYRECDDLLAGAKWEDNVHWLCVDELDLPDPYIGMKPMLYNVDCVGYESIMLGMFQMNKGPLNNYCGDRGVPKITELVPMYSRDGYNFSRPMRDPIIPASRYKGSWDRGYIESVGGILVIQPDELWIYYIGFAGDERFDRSSSKSDNDTGMYMHGATGIAKLRRDGFVSMRGRGSLLTRRLEFYGKESMSVNCVGSVKVTLLDDTGDELASASFLGDSTNARLDFGDFSVASLNGKPFRVRFDLDGELYSFGFANKCGDFEGAHAAGMVK